MIASDAEELISSIDFKLLLQANIDKCSAFRTRLDELNRILAELDERVTVINAFTNRNFEKPDVANKAVAINNQLNTIIETYRQDPGSIITLNTIVLKNALRTVTNDFDSYIAETWRVYTNKANQTTLQDLNSIGAIPIFAKIVNEIKILLIQIDNCRKAIPKGESDFKKFDRLMIEFETAWEELGSTDLPSEVQIFLQAAVTRDGAALNLLTTEVRDWLKTKGIDKSLRIHMGIS